MALWDHFLTKGEGETSKDLNPIVQQSPRPDVYSGTSTQTPPPATTSDVTAPTRVDRSGPVRRVESRLRKSYTRFQRPAAKAPVAPPKGAKAPEPPKATPVTPPVQKAPEPPRPAPVAPPVQKAPEVKPAPPAAKAPEPPKPVPVVKPAPPPVPVEDSAPSFLPPTARPKMKRLAAPTASARVQDSVTWLRRGVVRQTRGDHQGAVEDLTKAIELDAGCADAYEARGVSREQIGDVEGARKDYEKAIGMAVNAEIQRQARENPDVPVR